MYSQEAGSQLHSLPSNQKMCLKKEVLQGGDESPGFIHTESAKREKKTVQISSFSFLGKEQEMGCDRIISKKSLPPLGSVEKNIQQRDSGLLFRKEDRNGQTRKNQSRGLKVVVNIFKLEGSGEFHFCPNQKQVMFLVGIDEKHQILASNAT